MTDFLLELRSEEIPARMQERARADLEKLFVAELDKAGLQATEIVTYATPRRLALIAKGLPQGTQAVSEELKGPPQGAPDQAVEGFCRKAGLTRDQLEVREVKGRATYFAVIDTPGRETTSVLAEAIPAVIRAFPWPKSMRWGAASTSTESLRWVRPLHGIVALFGENVVDFEFAGIRSGSATLGHRFHHPGAITIGSAADYVEKLRACHVIVDGAERRNIIALGAKMAAKKANLALVEDEGLLYENAGLTEWPAPLLGRFDEGFLDVPPEVIQLTARVNQKYFVCTPLPPAGGAGGGQSPEDNAASGHALPPTPSRTREGELANAFVCVANIDAADGGERIVAGNEKVLAARLSDARFFYDTDRKTKLEDLTPRLEKIVFHEKLGTVADKVERVAKLARWLVEEGIVGTAATTPPFASSKVETRDPGAAQERVSTSLDTNGDRARLAALAERAARLAKADLVTGMVGEFPELQGLMGGYYAAAQGEPPEVADAIRDHYKPVGQGDEVPTAPVTVAVGLADKLDTIAAFFVIGEKPTGSKDPFALRRAALGILRLLSENAIRFPLSTVRPELVEGLSFVAEEQGGTSTGSAPTAWWNEILLFFADRLKVQQREAGVRHDLIDAVFALGGEDDLVRLLARVKALQAFVATEDGANLLAGYKRAANILKKEGWGDTPSASVAPAQAGAHGFGEQPQAAEAKDMDSRLRGKDDEGAEKTLSYAPEPAENALIDALDAAEPQATAAIAREDFEGAMAALASLRAPIDAFFDTVTVNDADPDKRTARLALLARMRDAVHRVADFSKIEGATI
ncbi:glycine--tRNA ligase subunit beta [Stakelama saccharophila]|uniref:Glycine--tRNA ligase beta subunit n=1 Tax=Stakelama saccharophila TaxID=3075605 RepID=A0ABZ0B7W7_9SPHN|nr:glycine--tRNA ligase subunit beta [Stakelama sp. W311]WNO53337.1 glycine--tRNA ligase subunit beta [Stakelama sp. W311]